MKQEDRLQQIHKYVENMKEIRMLSTPDLNTIDNADDYGKILIENFSKIGTNVRITTGKRTNSAFTTTVDSLHILTFLNLLQSKSMNIPQKEFSFYKTPAMNRFLLL